LQQTYEEASDVEIKTVETVAEPVSEQPTEKVKKEKQPFKSGFTATVYYGDCGKDLDKSITKSIRSLKIKAGITDNIYGAYDPYITNGTFIAKAHFGFSTDKGFDDLSLILGLNTNIIDITAGASISQKLVLGAQGSLGFNFGKYVNLTFDGIAKYDLFTSNLNSYGAMATLSLSKNSFYGAIGASYNVAENLFGPTVAVSRNRVGSYVLDNGTSPIVDLYGALSLSGKHLSMNINGYMPINLNVFDNSYYSIGSASLSADQFNGSISLKFKGLTFTAGGQYNGLVGKAVKLVRNIKDTSAVKANIKNILRFTDSMLYFSGELKLGNYVSVFGTMSYTNENLHNHSLDVKAGAKITI
ncbi:MAG: hypothetical protein HUK24_09090, partial [Sphaerochaetaceae bacterium]|nr:hypothetical protein [Sphaerochaetaceae bacterium]